VEKRGVAKPMRWTVSLTKGAGALDAVVSERAAAQEGAEQLGAHPAVQSLQKVFPGSKVEKVRVKN
jgi:hypothetical protein